MFYHLFSGLYDVLMCIIYKIILNLHSINANIGVVFYSSCCTMEQRLSTARYFRYTAGESPAAVSNSVWNIITTHYYTFDNKGSLQLCHACWSHHCYSSPNKHYTLLSLPFIFTSDLSLFFLSQTYQVKNQRLRRVFTSCVLLLALGL